MKMFDVFNQCDAVETGVKVMFAVSDEYDDGVSPHEMAHKAIECHDELLAALEAFRAEVPDNRHSELAGVDPYRIDESVLNAIDAAIAKAKR